MATSVCAYRMHCCLCNSTTDDKFVRPWSHGGDVAQVMAATALGQLNYSITGVPVEGKLVRIRKGDGHSKRKDMVSAVTTSTSFLATTCTMTAIRCCLSQVCYLVVFDQKHGSRYMCRTIIVLVMGRRPL
jgi:hypothetical protein